MFNKMLNVNGCGQGEKNFPLVSVAVITYNQKEFLRECLESVLAQEYPNLEIVVADDCSVDGTQEMLREYSERCPGKFVLRLAEKNQGITTNSNAAHFACSGKYIAWMGGDDLMLPGKVREQVDFMERNPECAICYHDLDVFDNDTGRTLYFFNKKIKPREGGVDKVIKYGVFNGGCATMLRASKAPRTGFNETIPVASDWLYWVESLISGGEIRYIDKVLGRYRRHADNVTNKKSTVSQNTIDHLNSCNYIMGRFPEYFSEAIYRYSDLLVSMRKHMPYFLVLTKSLRITFRLKVLGALVLYVFSVGLIKI